MAKQKSVTPPAPQSQAVRIGGLALTCALAQAKANKMTLRGTVETLLLQWQQTADTVPMTPPTAATAKRTAKKGASK